MRIRTAKKIVERFGITWLMLTLPDDRGRSVEYWNIPEKYNCKAVRKVLKERFPFNVPIGYQRVSGPIKSLTIIRE